MFEVAYTFKDKNGFIKEHKAKFVYLQDAIRFIRAIGISLSDSGNKLIGKPSLERA